MDFQKSTDIMDTHMHIHDFWMSVFYILSKLDIHIDMQAGMYM